MTDVAARPFRLRLETDGPYDDAHAIGLLAAHSVPGAELTDVEARTHSRLVDVADRGEPSRVLRIDLRLDDRGADVTATASAGLPPSPRDAERVEHLVRRWLDLDADVAAVIAVFRDDPVLGPLVQARPGIRVTGSPDGWEAAVTTVLGQQVSLAAARTFAGRLVAALGSDVPGTGLRRFPRADVVAATPVDDLRAAVGVTGARARTLHAVAETVAGGLVIAPDGDRAAVRATLLALPGIGPWTVDYLSVRSLGDRDAYPAGDLVLRRSLGGVTTRQAEVASAPWAPWRAYALFHLWSAALPAGP
ncbi:DNA-3-methyladenine glycosylase 2 [Frigoribacterium faeni]|uniref:DNA-3-methyladenine glycosylase 2 n=1 Tax=Frigoribacterium faeni TaxID=145483 RepID=UPI003263C0E4|nr:3-methyladenine DNA glycosylase/8-oxoguanine DNA glycosylase [Frigoribacterium faeni]